MTKITRYLEMGVDKIDMGVHRLGVSWTSCQAICEDTAAESGSAY